MELSLEQFGATLALGAYALFGVQIVMAIWNKTSLFARVRGADVMPQAGATMFLAALSFGLGMILEGLTAHLLRGDRLTPMFSITSYPLARLDNEGRATSLLALIDESRASRGPRATGLDSIAVTSRESAFERTLRCLDVGDTGIRLSRLDRDTLLLADGKQRLADLGNMLAEPLDEIQERSRPLAGFNESVDARMRRMSFARAFWLTSAGIFIFGILAVTWHDFACAFRSALARWNGSSMDGITRQQPFAARAGGSIWCVVQPTLLHLAAVTLILTWFGVVPPMRQWEVGCAVAIAVITLVSMRCDTSWSRASRYVVLAACVYYAAVRGYGLNVAPYRFAERFVLEASSVALMFTLLVSIVYGSKMDSDPDKLAFMRTALLMSFAVGFFGMFAYQYERQEMNHELFTVARYSLTPRSGSCTFDPPHS